MRPSHRLAWGLGALAALMMAFGAVAVSASHSSMPRVPRLVGMTLDRAARLLSVRGLRSGARGSLRYAPAATSSSPQGLTLLGSNIDGRRRVTAQSIPAGSSVSTGSVVELGTAHPPRRSGRVGPEIVEVPFSSYAIGGDDRTLTLEISQSVAQCAAIDHVETSDAGPALVASVFAITNSATASSCRQRGSVLLRMALVRPLAGRSLLRFAPSAPTRGLSKITAGRWGQYSALPGSWAIGVYFERSSNCGLLSGATVRETASEVAITITVGDEGSICLADARLDAAVVKLSAPLGQRRIVDHFRARLGRVAVRLRACCSTIGVAIGPNGSGSPSPTRDMPRIVRLLDASGNVAATQAVALGHTALLTAPLGPYTLKAQGCFPERQVTVFGKRAGRVTLSCPIP